MLFFFKSLHFSTISLVIVLKKQIASLTPLVVQGRILKMDLFGMTPSQLGEQVVRRSPAGPPVEQAWPVGSLGYCHHLARDQDGSLCPLTTPYFVKRGIWHIPTLLPTFLCLGCYINSH